MGSHRAAKAPESGTAVGGGPGVLGVGTHRAAVEPEPRAQTRAARHSSVVWGVDALGGCGISGVGAHRGVMKPESAVQHM